MSLPKNAVEFEAFCKQYDISPTRYRRLANLGLAPAPEGKNVDFIKASLALYKLARAGDVYIEDWCLEGFGISSERYRQLGKEGKVPPIKNGMINLKIAVPALISYYRNMGDNDTTLTDERRRKTKADADMAELELQELQGSLIRREEVAQELVNRVYTLKGDLLALPKRLAKHQEAKAIAAKYVRQLMKTYSRKTGVFKK